MFDWQLARRAFSRARAKTGNKIAASSEIIAITTKSSIKVKALRLLVRVEDDTLRAGKLN
jgi:hypothetical protein